jgi:hypothetical protein
MTVRLEHANLCVRDIEDMIRFLQTAFPEFRVRGEGVSNDGTRWVHIGTDEARHLALPHRRESRRRGLGCFVYKAEDTRLHRFVASSS